jgi:peptide/nickel transport system permease protein
MTLFLARRMLATIPLMLIVSMVVFFMVAIIPGDAALVAAGESGTPGNLSSIRKDLGLDRPAPVRYLDWLSDALRGDLGRSYLTRQPVAEKLISRLPVSLEVGFEGRSSTWPSPRSECWDSRCPRS